MVVLFVKHVSKVRFKKIFSKLRYSLIGMRSKDWVEIDAIYLYEAYF